MTSPKVASIEYNSHCKTCFITLPASLAAQYHRVECAAFELQWANDCQAYMSWGGEITRDGKDEAIIEINGLYANKLGLPNGQEVLLKPLCSVPSCSTANIEPLSVDDWEILELHAGYIESQLLSQLRIVWPGQVFPVWINKNICIFMKIDQIMPTATCYAKLEQHTEVIVAPKSRLSESFNKPTRHQHQLEPKPKSKSLLEASTHGSVANGSMDGVNSCSTLRNSELPGNGSHGKERLESVDHVRKYGLILENGRLEWSLYPAWYASKIFNYVRKIVSSPEVERNETKGKKEDVDDDEDVDEEIDLSDVDLVVRVHPMCDSTIVTESLSRPPSYAQQLTQQALSKVDLGPLEADPSDNYSHLMQPTTVFVKRNTLLNAMASEEKKSQVRMLLDTDHCSFLALLTRLSSPKERMEEMRKKILDNEEKSKKKETVADEKKVAEKKSKDPEKIAEQQSSFVVRIIVYNDEFSIHSGDEFKSVSMVPSDYLQGDFVQVQDLLRRQLNLEVTSKVWLHGLKHEASNISSIQLQPFTKLPEDIKKEEILYSFQHWLTCVSCMIYPLPVSQETLVRFPVSRAADIYAEFMLFVKSNTKEDNEYFLLHPFIARKVTPSVNLIPYTQPVTLPRMPCNSVSDIDSTIITPRLRNLGSVNDIGQQALDHLRASLNIRPLANYICKSTSGLLNGGLLIYGPKGSGKSSLGRALCRELHEWPYLCHCVIIECKQLKGKRVESIRKIWEEAFREAFWREPAIILLDDLDHVTSAPLGPEEEVGPEAVYNTRIAQLLKDITQSSLSSKHRVALIATSKTQKSVHSSLTATRGTHIFQNMLEITPPDRVGRREILMSVIEGKTEVDLQSINIINIDDVASKTEGYVPKDMVTLVERAIHAASTREMDVKPSDIMLTEDGEMGELLLTDLDMECALKDFTPMSLLNVPLHDAGSLGWESVGGLHEIKEALIETLQLPSKFPALFSNSPLRLRSGILLYGAPGTGKTLLAGVVAKECGLHFISIKGPELLSKYIGASEQAVRDMFIRAQSAKPCILFFDEFDSLAPRRGHDSTGVTDRVVNQLLTQLDGVESLDGVYVLAATSRPDLIDPALLRPGRLDKCLYCPLPSQDERLEIIQALSTNLELDEDVDLSVLADQCDGFTGADYKALLYNAQLEAIHGLIVNKRSQDYEMEPFNDRIPEKMSPKDWQLTFFESMEQYSETGKAKSGNDDDVAAAAAAATMATDQDLGRSITEPWQFANVQLDNHGNVTVNGKNNALPKEDTEFGGKQKVVYMPTVRDGVVDSASIVPDSIMTELNIIRRNYNQQESRSNKTNDADSRQMKSINISQDHLLKAASSMRQSVSPSERRRYQLIYESFVKSREGNFPRQQSTEGKRATLA